VAVVLRDDVTRLDPGLLTGGVTTRTCFGPRTSTVSTVGSPRSALPRASGESGSALRMLGLDRKPSRPSGSKNWTNLS